MNTNLLGMGAAIYRTPSSKMPRILNPRLSNIWLDVVRNLQPSQPSRQWIRATLEFVERAEAAGFSPFNTRENSVILSRLNTQLRSDRVDVKRFIKSSELESHLRLAKRATEEIRLTDDGGFVIRVRINVEDVNDTGINEWAIRNFRYRRSGKKFTQKMSPTLTMILENSGSWMTKRWYFGYDIVCKEAPILNTLNVATVENFIRQRVWTPVSQSVRSHGQVSY